MTVTETIERPTRERIIDAALDLFSEGGYEGTSVGEIESAAGLAPRSGALYKHFPSKRALLDAALVERAGAVESIEHQMALLPLGDIRSELILIARLGLDELERERRLARLVMKEGDRFPEIATAFHDGVVRRGHLIAESWVGERLPAEGIRFADPEAVAQVLTDALVGYALQHFIFGDRLEAVGRERFVATWVDTACALIEHATKKETVDEQASS